MEIVRFYSNDAGAVEYLAKYALNADHADARLVDLCSPVMEGMEDVPDVYDIINKRILDLDSKMVDAGFERLPALDTDDTDKRCSRAYDVVLDPGGRTVTLISYEIKPMDDPDTPYAKTLVGSKVIAGKAAAN